ncbi:MAG TPA: LL-diaminopimelate aminotransferase [Actinomycetota bacterium]|nr:LL-diaminopimelate aminotransferase [Actinomycetota bacterium]
MKSAVFRPAARVRDIPPYLFAEIDRMIGELKARGADIISFGIGDPDFPTPPHIVAALQEAAADPATHRYPSYYGLPELREGISDWFSARFGVSLDPSHQILPLWGSKEGVAHLPWAVIDEGDVALCSDPGYPVYDVGTRLAGGTPVAVPCRIEDGFLPDFDSIDQGVAARAKLLWLNYPGNPTSATCDLEFFERAVDFCRRHEILLAHDAAYSEVTYDGYVAPSVLQVPGASEVAVELHSFSKTYNMTGWRIGWICGSPAVIEALGTLKTNLDSGVFNAIQRAAIAALRGPRDFLDGQLRVLQARRDRVVDALTASGLDVTAPRGSLYVWAPVPDGETSAGYAKRMLEEAEVAITPGSGYGRHGEGYVRLSLTLADDRLDEGLARIREASGA